MLLPTHLRPRRVLPLLSLAVVMLLTTGFMGSRAPAPHPRVPPSVHVTKLTVTATEFALAPAALEAAAGQPVEVTFINKGASTHNWAVPSLAATSLQVLSMPTDLPGVYIHDMIKLINGGHPMIVAGPNQRAVIRFTPLDVGSYQILCTIPGHKEMGIVGMLVVPLSHLEPGVAGGIHPEGQGADGVIRRPIMYP